MARFTASGPEPVRRGGRAGGARSPTGIEVRDEVGPPGTGPVAFASFTFADTSPGSVLVVPRVLVGRRDGPSWITEFSHGDGPSAVRAVEPGPAQRHRCATPTAGSRWPGYRAAVAEAVRRMRAGALDKAALAHDLLAIDDAPLDARFLLARAGPALPDAAGRTRSTGWSAPPRSC